MNDLETTVIEEIRKCATSIDGQTLIDAETRLLDDGLLTSLELLELVVGLESRLSIAIQLEFLSSKNFATVGTICTMLEPIKSET